jgi:starch-binding outer membrane protein, SusD/RagB family
MKKIYIYLYLLVIIALTSGCLDTDSDLLAYPDETQLDSPSDSLYSIVGILNRVEKLADSYVLLGELRGDLMDISTDANADLKEIYNHEISENNAYNNVRDYYSVINYCNYVIQNIDTTITVRSKKVNYKTYAAAKAFRAWTYLQLGLNYGNVKYYQDPILKVKDSSNYVVYSLQELIPVLIQELLPWQDIETPVGFSLGSDLTSSRDCFFRYGYCWAIYTFGMVIMRMLPLYIMI